MLVLSKILHQNTSKILSKIIGIQHRTSKYQQHLRIFVIHFFDCNLSSKNLLFLFLQKIRRPVLFCCKLIILIAIDRQIRQKKQLRILFQTFRKIPTGTSAVKFSVKLSPTNMLFVNSSRLNFFPDFQNTEEHSRGDLQKQLFSIN